MPLNVMIFDQYSRYKACSDLLRQTGFVAGNSVLDIGSGPECLFGQFIPDAAINYVDPLIPIGSGHGRITGDVFTGELDGQTFDCVSAVDVFEHVPSEHRRAFLERFSSLGKNTLILGFPTSDSSDATETDKAIDDHYRAIVGHNYSWLEEHYRFGLPSLAETAEQLTQMGWHCQSIGHGHAPWLRELLGFVICVWDIPGLKDVVVEISEKFNRELYSFDFRPPYYRQFLIATRTPVPSLRVPEHPDDTVDAEAGFRALMGDAYRLYFAASMRQISDSKAVVSERDAEIVRLNTAIQEVSSWATGLNATLAERGKEIDALNGSLAEREMEIERLNTKLLAVSFSTNGLSEQLIQKQSELIRVSDWANSMRQELESRNLLLIYKVGAGIARLKQIARRRLANTFVGDLVRYARDKRNRQKAKGSFEAARASLIANDGKLIITFPIITWNFRWQRPQHIVTRLRNKGYAVLYVAMSVTALGRKIRNKNEAVTLVRFNILDQHIQKIWLHSTAKLNVYTDPITGDDLHNLVSGLDAAISELQPKSIQYLIQFPGWWPVAQKLREIHGGKVIFDCMDDHGGFTTNRAQALQAEEHLITNADLVITSSNLLEQKVCLLNPKTVQVKNGTEFEHFSTPKPNGELDHLLGRPIIGYYGAISDWFDMSIVAYCAASHPDWNFVLIGSTHGADLKPVELLSNVHFLGEKAYAALPGYLAYFDVCTIPFKVIPLTLATNPVKFYEYLSAGKPVVSVALPELLAYGEDCYLAEDAVEFDRLLMRALAEKNDPEKVERRTKLAKENSWDSRADAIVDAMKTL